MKCNGIPVFTGKEIGQVLRLDNALKFNIDEKSCYSVDKERDVWLKSVSKVLNSMESDKQRFLSENQKTKSDLMDIQITLIKDKVFQNKVNTFLNEGFSASAAVLKTASWEKDSLKHLNNNYLKERCKDIEDMGTRLVCQICGYKYTNLSDIKQGTIVVAKDLFPSVLMNVKCGSLNGIILEEGSATSHAAILAGSMEIPTLVQCTDAKKLKNGDTVFLNAAGGYVEGPLSKEKTEYIAEKLSAYRKNKNDLKNLCKFPAKTKDGHRVNVMANITNADGKDKILQTGADGVGLFRTEFLFMNRPDLPTEEEQFKCYSSIAKKLSGKPLTIRTIDIGADKKVESLKLEKELNPFLGYRAIRICADHEKIFLTQLRACLRASAFGKIKIMFPMISNLKEIRMAKSAVKKAKRQLDDAGEKYDDTVKIGMMMEIPSAVLLADKFAKEVDFFSIGSNDLTQYTLAVDRLNSKVNYLYDPLNPAVLKLIAKTIYTASRAKIDCSLCGEMAANPLAVPLLLGFGLKNFSMNSGKIPLFKKLISLLEFDKLKPFSYECLNAEDSDEVKSSLKSFLGAQYLNWVS